MSAFTDQVAVITGASSGVGKAIALRLASEGATVCLVGRKRERLEAVADSARAMGPRVLTYQTDLAADESIRNLRASRGRF
jgi:short-subunit dehydrogenase